MFITTYLYRGETFHLRSTIFTSQRDRATVYATVEEAHAAIAKAAQFMRGGKREAKKVMVIPA